MQHLMLWPLLLIILAACGTTTNVIETPEAIHVRWLAAVRTNDRAAALALMDADMAERERFVSAHKSWVTLSPAGVPDDVANTDPTPRSA